MKNKAKMKCPDCGKRFTHLELEKLDEMTYCPRCHFGVSYWCFVAPYPYEPWGKTK